MRSHFSFLILFFLLSGGLLSPCAAVPISFNDLNLVERDISIYQISENGTTLISSPGSISSNMTIDLDPAGSYQIVLEPSHLTFYDDPMNTLEYFINDAAGQTIVFLCSALIFVAIIRLIFR